MINLKKGIELANVNSPKHYQGGIECIDVIELILGTKGVIFFCLGNVIKYLWRWRDKNGKEDLKKAEWYLRRTDTYFISKKRLVEAKEILEGLVEEAIERGETDD